MKKDILWKINLISIFLSKNIFLDSKAGPADYTVNVNKTECLYILMLDVIYGGIM